MSCSSTVTRTAATPMSSVARPPDPGAGPARRLTVPVGVIVPFGKRVPGDLHVDRELALVRCSTSSIRGRRSPARRTSRSLLEVERCGVGPVVAGPADVDRRRDAAVPAPARWRPTAARREVLAGRAVPEGDRHVVEALVVGRRARERHRAAGRHRERWARSPAGSSPPASRSSPSAGRPCRSRSSVRSALSRGRTGRPCRPRSPAPSTRLRRERSPPTTRSRWSRRRRPAGPRNVL